MKSTHYLTVTVQKSNRLEIHLPQLTEGEDVEVIVILPDGENMTENNEIFADMRKKSIKQRRQIMLEQAHKMQKYYEEDNSWQEWENIDLGNGYDS